MQRKKGGQLSHRHSKTVAFILFKALDIFQPLPMGQLLEGLPLALLALRPNRNGRRVRYVHGLLQVAGQGLSVVSHSVKPAIGGFLPAGFKVCQLPVKEQIFQVIFQKSFIVQAGISASVSLWRDESDVLAVG